MKNADSFASPVLCSCLSDKKLSYEINDEKCSPSNGVDKLMKTTFAVSKAYTLKTVSSK